MAGLFGLFGGKKEPENKESFFLDEDDAQSLGDIKFMRKPVKVKRTFPTTKGNKGGFAIEKELSSLDYGSNGQIKPKSINSNNGVSQTVKSFDNTINGNKSKAEGQSQANSNERSTSDSSMDMFRNMARDLRKR